MAEPARTDRRGHVATGASSRSSRSRRTLHIAVGLLGWVVFAGLWVWQLEVFVPANWLAGIKILGAVLGLFAILTPTWVAWNRRIYRRRHRRTAALLLEVDFERDALGREIDADPGVRSSAGEIVVDLAEGERTKRYRVVRA